MNSRKALLPHRCLEGLALVALLPERPRYIPASRSRGSKAAGRAYEKKVGRWLKRMYPELNSGQWFEFVDENGKGCCQVDHYVVLKDQVLLFECKLSQTPVAYTQMNLLYKPILEHVYGKHVTCIQICKYLREQDARQIEHPGQARIGGTYVWHCLL